MQTPASFADFNLPASLLQALEELNFTQPTPVQALVLPPTLEGQDVAGQAPTGSGKTAAYGLAVLAQVDPAAKAVQAIVLVPARELALQVRDALKSLGKHMAAPGLRVAALYGGHAMRDEVQTLQQTPHVVVATPGRLLDHLEKRNIIPNQLKVLVLDEADKLLDLKFQEEMATIVSRLPRRRQTLLFSATMPDKVMALVRDYLTRPRMLTAAGGLNGEITGAALPASLTLRGHVLNAVEDKPAALYHLLQQPETGQTLIFANTRDKVEELAQFLRGRGVAAEVLHGKLPQPERDKALMKLRNNSAQALVATDVAARGIDVPQVSHVVNFDVPLIFDDYVHRIGRTGRARHTGAAITFANPAERQHIERIEELIKQEIPLMLIPEEVEVTATPFTEEQTHARVLDEQRRREDPTFKGAFHEKKEWIKPGVTIDKRTGKAFEEGRKKSQKGSKKNPGKKGKSAPASKALRRRGQ